MKLARKEKQKLGYGKLKRWDPTEKLKKLGQKSRRERSDLERY